jgi:outer membrane lipoprotein-sorting protein
MRKPTRLAFFAAALVLVLSASPAYAADTNAYQRMVATLNALKTYQATVHSTISLQPVSGQGRPNTISFVETIVYERPNKLSVKAVGGMGGMQMVSDGKVMYQYSSLANQYTQRPAPANLLRQVLYNGAASSFKQEGTTTLNGIPVIELAGTRSTPQGRAKTTLYVGTKDHLPYRIRVVLPHLPGQEGSAFRMVSVQDFSNQRVNIPVPMSAFRFTPPANSTKVSSLGFGRQTGSAMGMPGLP